MRWLMHWLKRWISWVIALLSLLLGGVIWHFGGNNAFLGRVDRTFQDGLIEAAQLPKRTPIAVALVEMEDAENWTALEYSLFLKSLPPKNPPVVVFTLLPPEGKTAFDRAFNVLAMKQPRLVLPVELTDETVDAEGANWWLKGSHAEEWKPIPPILTAVKAGPAEALRGTVEVGVANETFSIDKVSQHSYAQIYFQIGKKNIPSLALRAALLARKLSDENVRLDVDLLLGKQRLKAMNNRSLKVDSSFLPGMHRIASSDLLLKLEGDTAATKPADEKLEGVLVLGDLSEKARALHMPEGAQLTPAEWIAATIATICNGPILTPVTLFVRAVILTLGILATFLFAGARGAAGKCLLFLGLLAFYSLICLFLAERSALSMPFTLPLGILLLAVALHHLAAIFLTKKHERDESN